MKKINFKYCCFFAVCFVYSFTGIINSQQSCQDAARSRAYSSNFFRAEYFFIQKAIDNDFSAKGVTPQGIPVGLNDKYTYNYNEIRNLTETQAYNYLEQELRDNRAQIVSECSAAICRLGNNSSVSGFSYLNRETAINAIEHICVQSISPTSTNTASTTTNSDFIFVRDRPIVLFQSSKAPKIVNLKIINHTRRKLTLKLLNPETPNPNIKFIGRAKTFSVLPGKIYEELKFQVTPPDNKFEPTSSDINIVDNVDNTKMITAKLTVGYIEAFEPKPQIMGGTIQPDGEMHADPTCPHNQIGQIFPINYGEVGPEEACLEGQHVTSNARARTTATADLSTASFRGVNSVVQINHKLVAVCNGNNGQNAAAHASVKPTYKTQIILPKISGSASWTASFSVTIQASSISSLSACSLSIKGNGVNKLISVPQDNVAHPLLATGLLDGTYDVTFSCPRMERSCDGQNGNGGEGTQSTQLNIDVSRSR